MILRIVDGSELNTDRYFVTYVQYMGLTYVPALRISTCVCIQSV